MPLQRHVRGSTAGVGDEEARRLLGVARDVVDLGRVENAAGEAVLVALDGRAGRRQCSGRGCTCRLTRNPRSVAHSTVGARPQQAPVADRRARSGARSSPASTCAAFPPPPHAEQRARATARARREQRRAPMCDARPDRGTWRCKVRVPDCKRSVFSTGISSKKGGRRLMTYLAKRGALGLRFSNLAACHDWWSSPWLSGL